MTQLTVGTFLRWTDPDPVQKPLGVVIQNPAGNDDTVYVLMADREGNTDVEVFIARPDATGVDAAALVLEAMEPVIEADAELMALLRTLGPTGGTSALTSMAATPSGSTPIACCAATPTHEPPAAISRTALAVIRIGGKELLAHPMRGTLRPTST